MKSRSVDRIKAALEERGLVAPLEKVCLAYNVTLNEVLSGKRTRRVVYARDACIVRALSSKGLSLKEVGALLEMDHTSILTARRRYTSRDNGRALT